MGRIYPEQYTESTDLSVKQDLQIFSYIKNLIQKEATGAYLLDLFSVITVAFALPPRSNHSWPSLTTISYRCLRFGSFYTKEPPEVEAPIVKCHHYSLESMPLHLNIVSSFYSFPFVSWTLLT